MKTENNDLNLTPVAYIRTDFPTKFGAPRQSGLTNLVSKVVFCKEWAKSEAVRGIEGYDYIWLIWGFHLSEPIKGATVRPPRLGGNVRMGVFATRSPVRPNPIGLSSVKLLAVDKTDGLTLVVSGADMADGTPIYDVKPYLPYTDSHAGAKAGFSDDVLGQTTEVEFAPSAQGKTDEKLCEELKKVLSLNPCPHYKKERKTYGFPFAGYEVKFVYDGEKITVTDIVKRDKDIVK